LRKYGIAIDITGEGPRTMCYILLERVAMLVFRRGEWIEVQIPDYVDPSWGYGDRQKAASLLYDFQSDGTSHRDAWIQVEKVIYSSIFGKQHSSPKNQKK